ncbi:hypothetical protein NPIL_555181 [Nephila pilipes]|uniref:Uncharacterized protein n=1 Tax=Nephila pilipes TaxID=299642 RepID=A0A8X6TTG5_NEPPI|nr:hypothetical protein NPIL_555181 [Nephila pilipes]
MMPTTRSVPRRSPSQVLTAPDDLNFGDRMRTGDFSMGKFVLDRVKYLECTVDRGVTTSLEVKMKAILGFPECQPQKVKKEHS